MNHTPKYRQQRISNGFRGFANVIVAVLALTCFVQHVTANPYGCNVPCPDCCPQEGPNLGPVGVSEGPVFFLNGTAIERETDLTLPSPTLNWSFTRAYDSGFVAGDGLTEVPSEIGFRWIAATKLPYLLFDGPLFLINSPASHRQFTYSSGVTYYGPGGYNAEIVVADLGTSDELYVLTEYDTGRVLKFHGFDANVPAYLQGKLYEETTEALEHVSGAVGIRYAYYSTGSTAGLISTITPATPQDTAYRIEFSYWSGSALDEDKDLLKQVEIIDEVTDAAIARVQYWYNGPLSAADLSITYSGELGDADEPDLIQVCRSTRATGDSAGTLSIVRYMQYRYYDDGDQLFDDDSVDDGHPHQLKMVFESDAIQRALDYSSGDSIQFPKQLLTLDDADTIGGVALKSFSSRAFTYYTAEVDTSDVDTAFADNEDLDAAYKGVDWDEVEFYWPFNLNDGAVRKEMINGGCSSCGGAGAIGITKEYYYMKAFDQTVIEQVVVEDTIDSNDAGSYRTVYGIDTYGFAVRKAVLTSPASPSASNIWCTSYELNSDHQVLQQRMPSAHKRIGSKGVDQNTLDEFFFPIASTNDADTLNDTGLVRHFEYQSFGSAKYPKAELVSQGLGTNSTKYYVSVTEWSNEASNGDVKIVPVSQYAFPTKIPQISGYTGGDKTTITYDFWSSTNDTIVSKRTVSSPIVPSGASGENGSGVAIETSEYFDTYGRKRWSVDGEGYITYFSYHPTVGGVAYVAADVDPGSPSSEISVGSTGKWVPLSDGDADSNKPTRDTTLPDELDIDTRREYDIVGRQTLMIDAGDSEHYTTYHNNLTIQFPYWDAGNNVALAPVQVVATNDGGVTTEEYGVAGSSSGYFDFSGGRPWGFSSTPPPQSTYTSWSRHFYNRLSGRLVKTLRYHNIPSGGGDGTHLTDYYVTAYDYDALGRRDVTIQTVQDSSGFKDQISKILYDKLGRPFSFSRDAGDSGVDTGADADLGTLSLSGLTDYRRILYDDDGVGDSQVTETRDYHTTTIRTDTTYHRTYRGHLRGMSRYDTGTSSNVLPQTVYDVDWMGRKTAQAQYVSAQTWSTVLTGDGYTDYTSATSNRRHWTKTHFDKLGRVYRTEQYPGSEGTKHFRIDNYYDRNGRLVCTGDLHAANTEYAYDGVGRQYQVRTVKNAPSSSPYTSGAFDYAEPVPAPGDRSDGVGLGMATGGNDEGVIAIEHMVYDDASNVVETHSLELNADETGIVFGDGNHVRRTSYSWYDAADRVESTVDYGSGDGSSSADAWALTTSLPARGTSAPTWTTAAVYNGYALLTQYDYDDAGRQSAVLSGVAKSGSNTTTIRTSTYFDDLGRRQFVVENHDGSYDPTGTPSSSADSNRTTGWTYNGLGNVSTLVAYNSAGGAQTTTYEYADPYDASLVTETEYPDSTGASDVVTRTYNLDGSLATMTDQRNVVHAYSYNSRRQLEIDSVSAGSGTLADLEVDDSVQSIKREYNNLGQLLNIYSYGSPNAAGTRRNGIWNQYNAGSGGNYSFAFWRQIQHHESDFTGSPEFVVNRDYNATSYVLHGGNRVARWIYPDGACLDFCRNDVSDWSGWYEPTSGSDLNDRLGRISHMIHKPSGGSYSKIISYKYNGRSRTVAADYEGPDVRRSMFGRDSAGANVFNGWDRFGRTKVHEWDTYSGSAETVIDRYDHTYDYAGNRLNRDMPNSLASTSSLVRDQLYSYDGLMRLETAEQGLLQSPTLMLGVDDQEWQLDALGNWVETYDGWGSANNYQDRTHNAANEITSFTNSANPQWATPAYDAAGNMTTIPQPDDPANSYTLVWDAWNRLVQVKDGSNVVQQNEYDGLNRRIVRHTDLNGNGTLETNGNDEIRHYYYNDQWQVVEERVGNNGEDGEDSYVDVQYVYHPYYIDAVAVRYRDANGDYDPNGTGDDGLEEALYYLHDANFNVTALANTSGAVVERYAYTPYGEVTVLDGAPAVDPDGTTEWDVDGDGSDIDNETLFSGRERDPVTGLQLNRNRYLAANLGRWVNRDPISYNGGSYNLYQYVSGRPVVQADPFGLMEWPWDWWDAPQEDDWQGVGQRVLACAPDRNLQPDVPELSVPHNNIEELVNNVDEALDDDECLHTLEIRGHGYYAGLCLGKDDDRCYSCSPEDNFVNAKNVEYIAERLKELDFCSPCVIYLSGCHTGSMKGGNTWPQVLADITGCNVYGTLGYKRGSVIGGGLSIGSSPRYSDQPESDKHRPTSSGWHLFTPKQPRPNPTGEGDCSPCKKKKKRRQTAK